jgi:Uma2 family endonuclease
MSAAIYRPPEKHRLSVADYHRMGEAGILGPNMRCELIEGEIIDMSPIGSRHAGVVRMLSERLTHATKTQAVVSTQAPVILSDLSEPEPDIALLKPRSDFYKKEHPHPKDVLLIIEVADASLRYDRDTKIPLYARSGITEVWLVDLQAKKLEVFQELAGDRYTNIQTHEAQKPLAPHALREAAITISDLFA